MSRSYTNFRYDQAAQGVQGAQGGAFKHTRRYTNTKPGHSSKPQTFMEMEGGKGRGRLKEYEAETISIASNLTLGQLTDSSFFYPSSAFGAFFIFQTI